MVHLVNISKQYGEKVLYKNGSFQILNQEKIGLVGPNGAGKTTIFRFIVGEEKPDSGQVVKSEKLVIGYFSQSVGEMNQNHSVLEEVLYGSGRVSQLAKLLKELESKMEVMATQDSLSEDFQKIIEEYGEIQSEFEQRGGYDLEARAKEVLSGLGFSLEDQKKEVRAFSGGWKMRIALAKILIMNPDVLLLDEPTNHLDLESIIWLEEWIKNFKGSVLMTSHDREFMNRIVTKIVEIANREITTYSGNYDFYEREKNIRLEQLQAAYQRQQEMLAKEQEFIDRFKARASHAAQVQSRVKKIEKLDLIELPEEEKTINFEFPKPPRSGNDVVVLKNLKKVYDTKLVFEKINGVIKRLDKIALVGVNGAGKSTLLKIIAQAVQPTEGSAELGASVSLGYFSQNSLEVLNSNNTVFDEVFNRLSDPSVGYVRNLLGAFLFSGDEVYKKISVLSGGEKSRVLLATLLAKPINFLVLDEPTNHLDIKSREVLMNAIKNFDGTVIVVSHDRYFLRQIANRVFELDHGELRVFEGDYDYYLSKKHQEKIN
jgi:ATP-binding cassette subfamily F protein 3